MNYKIKHNKATNPIRYAHSDVQKQRAGYLKHYTLKI